MRMVAAWSAKVCLIKYALWQWYPKLGRFDARGSSPQMYCISQAFCSEFCVLHINIQMGLWSTMSHVCDAGPVFVWLVTRSPPLARRGAWEQMDTIIKHTGPNPIFDIH